MSRAAVGGFGAAVRDAFGRRARTYDTRARLQRAVAERLAHCCRDLPLPAGPRADLGAGSGLLSRALLRQWPALGGLPPRQVDHCAELLARNPLAAPGLVWDLNRGLPPELAGAALLASSFALQWLEAPADQLARWCRGLRPGGRLLLALPTAGSFPQWRRAAAAAGVPCTALALPPADELRRAAGAAGLQAERVSLLRFSQPRQGGLTALQGLRALGAGTSRRPPLTPAQLRRLRDHWPPDTPLTWEVLLLIGTRR